MELLFFGWYFLRIFSILCAYVDHVSLGDLTRSMTLLVLS
ncbi:MAG: hypothetical protein ACD_2C00032G0003 [uncultured bacterium (gcode 4)]|uniref:Uncharacterized protein n=1 Tax=uncultured bacterium (gcode 4) TaxID=1234023 RepID=K2G4M2_9BACT|nr:MAG: hypothetical protein ACD_2C00032G0003 [uncultured bacterium (gcode 4)]